MSGCGSSDIRFPLFIKGQLSIIQKVILCADNLIPFSYKLRKLFCFLRSIYDIKRKKKKQRKWELQTVLFL